MVTETMSITYPWSDTEIVVHMLRDFVSHEFVLSNSHGDNAIRI